MEFPASVLFPSPAHCRAASPSIFLFLSQAIFFRSSPTDGWWQTDLRARVVQSLVQATTSHPPASYNCALHVSEHEWNSRNDHFALCRALRSCPLVKGLQHPRVLTYEFQGRSGRPRGVRSMADQTSIQLVTAGGAKRAAPEILGTT